VREGVSERHRRITRRDLSVRKRKVRTGFTGQRAVAAEAAARKSLSRIASQALTTTVVVLAVVLDPPATGPAGRMLSARLTVILSGLRPSLSAAA
jgi:hypothetical protein